MRPDPVVTGKMIRLLGKRYPGKAMVDFGTAEDTLIATLLSARTRDEQVLAVYPGLRKAFPRLLDLARAEPDEIAASISSIGLYRQKAKAVHLLAKKLLNEFEGEVPKTMEELVTLPGVGRKTASCVLWYAFGIPAVAVDTHVFRITRRLGWTKKSDVREVEEELKCVVPKALWGEMNRVFVQFGRTRCLPRNPRCAECPLVSQCPTGKKRLKEKRLA